MHPILIALETDPDEDNDDDAHYPRHTRRIGIIKTVIAGERRLIDIQHGNHARRPRPPVRHQLKAGELLTIPHDARGDQVKSSRGDHGQRDVEKRSEHVGPVDAGRLVKSVGTFFNAAMYMTMLPPIPNHTP